MGAGLECVSREGRLPSARVPYVGVSSALGGCGQKTENLPLLEGHAPLADGAQPEMLGAHGDEGHEAQLEPHPRLDADGSGFREIKVSTPATGMRFERTRYVRLLHLGQILGVWSPSESGFMRVGHPTGGGWSGLLICATAYSLLIRLRTHYRKADWEALFSEAAAPPETENTHRTWSWLL